MATEVSICNLALAHLAQNANISALGEQSVEAQYCTQFYSAARDQLLAMHSWNFSTKRIALALLINDVDSWQYAYARPADCLDPIALLLPSSTDDTLQQDFVQELNNADVQVIRSNVENAVLKYTQLVADTTRFTPLFVIALSYLLGAYLAGPMTHDVQKQKWCLEMANRTLGMAAENDANSQQNNSYGDAHRPSMLSRGSSQPLTLNDLIA